MHLLQDRKSGHSAGPTLLLAVALIAFACAAPQRWQVREKPTKEEAGLLLAETDPQAVRREYFSHEVPKIPVRERLRGSWLTEEQTDRDGTDFRLILRYDIPVI